MTSPPSTPALPPIWDPTDPAFRADPYPFYDRLRNEAPASRNEIGTLVLTRYSDVSRTLRSNDFSRDIETNATERHDPISTRRRERRASGASGAKTILNLDPPDHTRLRRLVTRAFTPSAIERLRPSIQSMVDQALDRAAQQGTMELIDDLAFPVPFQVISELLDMPAGRAEELRDWSQAITASLEPTADLATLDASDAAIGQLIPYLIDVIEDRRRSPGEDMLSGLIAAEESGDRLSPAELISFVVLLYVAGHETTVNLIGNGVLALLRHRSELDRWRADPGMDDRAVDELLRYDGPVQHTVRVAMVPVEYEGAHGELIRVEPGETVLTVLGAANHDPQVFEAPHELRLDRDNAHRHLAFAAGIHYCLGASLAKLEAQIAIGSLIRRFPNMELAGEPHWRDRITIRGVDRLALKLNL
jgi:cytochrome P450